MTDEVRKAVSVLRDRKLWPLDEMAEWFDEAGISYPRPSEVLTAFFAILGSADD